MSLIKPKMKVPNIEVNTVNRGLWKLHDETPVNFTLVVFYRGIHCPLCRKQLVELDHCLNEFENQGIEVIAISCDSQAKAEKTVEQWSLKTLTIGYDFPLALARDLGLFVSKSINDEESSEFVEPAYMLVKPGGELYAISMQSLPFARPDLKAIPSAVEFVVKENYPARGEQ